MTKKELENKISDLEKQLVELKEELKKQDNKMPVGKIWEPKKDERYYFNYGNGTTDYTTIVDIAFTQVGNCYQTKEKAEFEAQREKYTRLFRQYVEQHSEPLDWHDEKQGKWYMYYNYYEEKIKYLVSSIYKELFVIYSSSEEVLQEAIDFVGEDNVKKYILEVKE